jgi:hypothetical protein
MEKKRFEVALFSPENDGDVVVTHTHTHTHTIHEL